MTDIASIKTINDPFWSRVRMALGTMRQERGPAYGQAAIARSIGIKPRLGARLEEELGLAWDRSRERKVSLSLLVIELDRFKEYFTAYGKLAADDCLMAAMEAIRDALPRDGDGVLRLGRASFVVVLPDFPMLMARATALKIALAVRDASLAHKESHAGIVTASIGLAVGNPSGNYDRKFFETAAGALAKAQRRGLNRIEAVDLRPDQERKRKAA
ncbi:diguanylate cyclase domain-containing protein [uncultured Devosia sp.]|uniref:diguanylate cyclase domain-containing protein n=1 Tax=uncultured Devosia sp. TaxID=211434 RepID=UPI0035CBF977